MAKRVDENQKVIVKALRQFGAKVQDLHVVGHGCPDLLVSYRYKNYLFEIKNSGSKLNATELDWHRHWAGPCFVIYTFEEAVEILTED